MGSLSAWHIIVLVILALVFFGPKRLPQIGESLGKAIRGLKDSLNEIEVKAEDVTHVEKEKLPPQKETVKKDDQA